jgi:apolipoprotein N-acyltransferase
MKSPVASVLGKAVLALAVGVLLRFVVDLRPVWWLVWLVPVPLLLIAFRFPLRDARWMVALAALVGASVNFHYFSLVMPLPAVMLSVILETLLWAFLIFATRRVVMRYRSWWTVFVYPVLWVAADTLMAALLADGNWGSLAYSQSDRLAILQTASLFGTAGVLFLIALLPSALALAITFGRSLRLGWVAYAITLLAIVAAILYGDLRLRRLVTGTETTFGVVSIDDPIGVRSPVAYAENIHEAYARHVAELGVRGAQIVILPEKIVMLSPAKTLDEQNRLSSLARQNRIWLEAGVGIDDGIRPTNWAWLFAPDGTIAAKYEKHHMAPPERLDHYESGSDYAIHNIDGKDYGLAICKDMHFATLGRAYGVRHATVMIVPAWDFSYLDGWLEARTTVMRGVENGYTIVRSSREGLLTVSDPFGRILAETPSHVMPGGTLLVTIPVTAQVPTLYTRIGNVLGWLCVVGAAGFLALG